MRQVDFLFGIHDHQPVGNFGHVFKDAFERCYRPFLDVFSQFPAVKCSIHTSGPLLEWLADNEPGYLDLLRAMVQAGRDAEKIALARAVRLMLDERVFLHGNRSVVFE